jgi:hypothetical protein
LNNVPTQDSAQGPIGCIDLASNRVDYAGFAESSGL